MKIYKKTNVYEEAIFRINYLFDEFENIVVSISGGKDSTIVLELCLKVAEERNRLPLKVMWVDQEAEWEGTVNYCKRIMLDKRVEPFWFQMPMVITNNANTKERYAYCWEEGKENEWIHPKNEISIKENIYGTMRFHELFEKISKKEWGNIKTAMIAGVRAEEAPKRATALTSHATYKWVTWGKKFKEDLYTFYPIYDWSYTDVWKYIHDNKVEYNKVYDEMYRHQVKINDMRISNLHHETAIQVLLLVQEIEPKTWNKVTKRITGANTIKHLKNKSFQCPKELPYMFKDWEEYALYLIENLVNLEENKNKINKIIEKDRKVYCGNENMKKKYYKVIINTILSADWDFTKIQNFRMVPENYFYMKYKTKKYHNITINEKIMTNLTEDEKKELLEGYKIWKESKKTSKTD